MSRCTLEGFIVLLLLFVLDPTRVQSDDKPKNKPATDAAADMTPKRFTLQGKDLSLAKVLHELANQTGNQVEDRRQVKDDIKIKVDLKNVTFWQALEAIAKEADLRINLYERDGKLALTDGPYQAIPCSYDGLFRTSIKRIQLNHLFDQDTKYCQITLEVAWEPRFQPLFMETMPQELDVKDDKDRSIGIPEAGRGLGAVGRGVAREVNFRIEAPPRSSAQLKTLKGKLMVVGPGKTLTFTFDKLTSIQKKEETITKTQDGVSVHLRELKSEGQAGDQVWTASLVLEYPADGPKFESFQSWVVNNDIFLQKEKEGLQQQFPPNLGYETEDIADNKVLVRYRFGDEADRKLLLGRFADWKLVYKTPGRIVEIPFEFELKDLNLP